MSERENYLRTIEMRNPEWIPCSVYFLKAAWKKYRGQLEEIIIKHPLVFGDYERGSVDFDDLGLRRKGVTCTDDWGCVWNHLVDGLTGQVVRHPLQDWKAFENFKPPDLLDLGGPPQLYGPPTESWEEVYRRLEEDRNKGKPVMGYCTHDFLFQRLYDLRGFKSFLLDTIRRPQHLLELIEIVAETNRKLIERWVELGVDVIVIGDDMGIQTRLTINPKAFRELIIPAYARMLAPARAAGVHVYLHSDGHILEVAEDLVRAGVTILNLQDRVNGIDNIEKICRGKVCIDLDIDRQGLLPFGSPKDIENHVRQVVIKLGSKNGGLMLKGEGNLDVPLANIEALCQAMEKHQFYPF